jgi:putative lipoprotein
LTSTAWAWQRTELADGKRIVARAPERYTIRFADGRASVVADCNRGGGGYQTGPGGSIAIGPIATTKKGCPDDSQDHEFLRSLASAESYRFEGSALVLELRNGAGAMWLRPLA